MEIPVYLFTGFLEAGKTKFIQETLCDPNFFEGGRERTLVLMCEEGEEELVPTDFGSKDVFVEVIDSQKRLNQDKLNALAKKYNITRVMIEYNGMWQVSDLFLNLPDNWVVYQEMMFADSTSIEVYNANMRNLVVDKLTGCDVVIFNRCDEDTDHEALHKLVRGVSRRAEIIYEDVNGALAYDDIEDPLPFDVNQPHIVIEDTDYALFYRDLKDNMADYDGKEITFMGQVRIGRKMPKDGFVVGRPVMTCCVEDIQFCGLFCESGAANVKPDGWVRITAKLNNKFSRVYGNKGPVLNFISAEPVAEPESPVATFY